MSLFIKVNSEEKKCPVIINLDYVVEIAPLKSGGSAIFFNDVLNGSRVSMTVTDNYELFEQFVMQTVTPEQIAKRAKALGAKAPTVTP